MVSNTTIKIAPKSISITVPLEAYMTCTLNDVFYYVVCIKLLFTADQSFYL